jgi:hypothetical protein
MITLCTSDIKNLYLPAARSPERCTCFQFILLSTPVQMGALPIGKDRRLKARAVRRLNVQGMTERAVKHAPYAPVPSRSVFRLNGCIA